MSALTGQERKGCCPSAGNSEGHNHDQKKKFDWIMHGSLIVIVPVLVLYYLNLDLPVIDPYLDALGHSLFELFITMWWGLALGLITVGIMNKIPREYFTSIMGRGDSALDIAKATIAGVLLDLCNHGILVISGKLYERGLSTAQIMAFLIASPWNSLTLTFILISLIGLKWTLVFTAASMLIAFVSGLIFLKFTNNGTLPQNPNTTPPDENFDIRADMKARIKGFRPTLSWVLSILKDGWNDGQMIIRWILFGTLIAATMNAFVPAYFFAEWLGPTALGLGITLVIATVIEVCSEGSAPIAAEIMNQGNAPGNGFAFLMAGVSTDYTEILVVREFTKSWKIALFLPLITVPQIVLLGILMNL